MKKKIGLFEIICIGIITVILLSAFYTLLLLIDFFYDGYVCGQEFIQIAYKYNYNHLEAFANDDSSILNFGQGEYCTVFWRDGDWLAEISFLKGTLTYEKIMSARYWVKP